MVGLLRRPRVSTTVSDQCEYSLLTPGPNGKPTPAMKPTRWASSSSHMLKRLCTPCKRHHVHQHLVGGRAKDAENYSPELMIEILRGMRDTADFEEEWGDETEASIEKAMMTSSLFNSPKFSTLVAAYRAQDLEEETRALNVKCKFRNGKSDVVSLKFKDSYKDEYTSEYLPIGHVRRAMHEELEYFCDKVWVAVPLSEAQNDAEGKIVGSRWVNCNKKTSMTLM